MIQIFVPLLESFQHNALVIVGGWLSLEAGLKSSASFDAVDAERLTV